ncbi:MAG: cytochrome c3 family protein [Chthoniobacterales bacterium]
MANFFPKWTNWLALKLVVCNVFISVALIAGIWYYFTPKYTRVGYQPDQPVPFSHVIHVEQLGLDCRYCHSYVELAAHSNIPTTATCMGCHGPGKVQSDNPKLAAVRKSAETGEPVDWVQIHKLPDYSYFNHAAHVNRGVSCQSCHGDVSAMEVVYQHEPQSMSWCLDCHRAPENKIRPPTEVFNMKWKPVEGGPTQREIGMKFKEEWDINPPTTCGGCHR